MLRPLEPEDLELLYSIENDSSLWWVGCQTAPCSHYALKQYIAGNQCDIYKDEQLRLVVEENGKALGLLDLFDFNPKNRRVEFGIALLKEAQGCGVASRAIEEMVGYCRSVLHLHQVVAIVPENNEASLRMLQRAGFEFGATLRSWLLTTENGEETYRNCSLMQLFL